MKNISSILSLKVFQKLLNVLSVVAFCSVGRTMYSRPTEPLTNKIIQLCEFKFYRIVRVVADAGIGANIPHPLYCPIPLENWVIYESAITVVTDN
jgi:hypothetical protein